MMKSQIGRWGNSLALRIPKYITEELALSVNDEVECRIENGQLMVTLIRKMPKYRLSQLIDQELEDESEIDWGKPRGGRGMVDYIPCYDDFIWLNFDPQSGHEQMGKRPALVLSQTEFNRYRGFIFVCPVSTTKRKNPFYVPIPPDYVVKGVVMSDQLRSLDYRSRAAEFISVCPENLLAEVLGRIYPILYKDN